MGEGYNVIMNLTTQYLRDERGYQQLDRLTFIVIEALIANRGFKKIHAYQGVHGSSRDKNHGPHTPLTQPAKCHEIRRHFHP